MSIQTAIVELMTILASSSIERELEQEFGISLSLSERPDKTLTLSKIVVPKEKRNQNIGSKVMERICSYADTHGITIFLSPSSDFGGSKARLGEFYKRFGFMPNKGKHKDFRHQETMVRQPLTKWRADVY